MLVSDNAVEGSLDRIVKEGIPAGAESVLAHVHSYDCLGEFFRLPGLAGVKDVKLEFMFGDDHLHPLKTFLAGTTMRAVEKFQVYAAAGVGKYRIDGWELEPLRRLTPSLSGRQVIVFNQKRKPRWEIGYETEHSGFHLVVEPEVRYAAVRAYHLPLVFDRLAAQRTEHLAVDCDRQFARGVMNMLHDLPHLRVLRLMNVQATPASVLMFTAGLPRGCRVTLTTPTPELRTPEFQRVLMTAPQGG